LLHIPSSTPGPCASPSTLAQVLVESSSSPVLVPSFLLPFPLSPLTTCTSPGSSHSPAHTRTRKAEKSKNSTKWVSLTSNNSSFSCAPSSFPYAPPDIIANQSPKTVRLLPPHKRQHPHPPHRRSRNNDHLIPLRTSTPSPPFSPYPATDCLPLGKQHAPPPPSPLLNSLPPPNPRNLLCTPLLNPLHPNGTSRWAPYNTPHPPHDRIRHTPNLRPHYQRSRQHGGRICLRASLDSTVRGTRRI